jgi:hypothetical protein
MLSATWSLINEYSHASCYRILNVTFRSLLLSRLIYWRPGSLMSLLLPSACQKYSVRPSVTTRETPNEFLWAWDYIYSWNIMQATAVTVCMSMSIGVPVCERCRKRDWHSVIKHSGTPDIWAICICRIKTWLPMDCLQVTRCCVSANMKHL